ncbi:indolethylamine N-methyltransferase-like [Haliotis cracherodii]|uniref:indolethylamine N-methyltransferase-like n=1 Tax=Haliotis cracherodii TaxID=6455 RepID=UPI0039EA6CBC
MTDKGLQYTEDYTADFDPQSYLEIFEEPNPNTTRGLQTSLNLTAFHHAYASGIIKGKTLLDIGTGPSILSLISAAQHCDNIFLSEFCPRNRELLKQWHHGSLKSHFDKSIEFVLKLEGKSEIDVPERATSIRDKILGILHCDIRNENPFTPNFLSSVDIITSSFCLETVATDLASYEGCARNVVGKLKPGGCLVVVGSLGGTYYTVGEKTFRCFGMSSDELKSAWQKVGIEIISWYAVTRPEIEPEFTDIDGCFCMVGKKVPETL